MSVKGGSSVLPGGASLSWQCRDAGTSHSARSGLGWRSLPLTAQREPILFCPHHPRITLSRGCREAQRGVAGEGQVSP